MSGQACKAYTVNPSTRAVCLCANTSVGYDRFCAYHSHIHAKVNTIYHDYSMDLRIVAMLRLCQKMIFYSKDCTKSFNASHDHFLAHNVFISKFRERVTDVLLRGYRFRRSLTAYDRRGLEWALSDHLEVMLVESLYDEQSSKTVYTTEDDQSVNFRIRNKDLFRVLLEEMETTNRSSIKFSWLMDSFTWRQELADLR
jgi:hypothetical protein